MMGQICYGVNQVFTAVQQMARFDGTGDYEKDDLIQDVMVRLLSKNQLSRPLKTAFLRSVVHNLAVDIYRSRKHRPQTDYSCQSKLENMMAVAETEKLADVGVASLIADALNSLPTGQREALLLYCDGRTYAKIAQLTGVTIGTVRSRVHYARQKMQLKLGSLL